MGGWLPSGRGAGRQTERGRAPAAGRPDAAGPGLRPGGRSVSVSLSMTAGHARLRPRRCPPADNRPTELPSVGPGRWPQIWRVVRLAAQTCFPEHEEDAEKFVGLLLLVKDSAVSVQVDVCFTFNLLIKHTSRGPSIGHTLNRFK